MIFIEQIALENVIVGENMGRCSIKTQFIWNCTLQTFIFLFDYVYDIHGHEMAAFICLDSFGSIHLSCLQMAEMKCIHIRGLQYLRVVYVLQG